MHLENDEFSLKRKSHPPTTLVKQQLTTKEKDTHTSSLNYLLPGEWGLPACSENRLMHGAHTLLKSGRQ